jgi:diguanylate cyclase (GGDEF)-like protein/PAS domain S-box-containing protein
MLALGAYATRRKLKQEEQPPPTGAASGRIIHVERLSTPIRASLIYLGLATLWILGSDYLLGRIADVPVQFSLMQGLKGVVFVVGTSLFLYLFLHRHLPADSASTPAKAPSTHTPLLVFAITAIALVATGYYTYRSLQARERIAAHNSLRSVGELKVRQISEWLRERRGDIGLLTRDTAIARDLQAWLREPASRPGFPDRLAERFEALKGAYDYSAMVLFDAQGRARWASRPGFVDMEVAQETGPVLKAIASGTTQLVDIHYHGPADEDRLVMGYVGPLTVDDGSEARPVGAIYLVVTAGDYLFPLVQSWPLPSASGETLIVRREGDRVRFLNSLRHRPDSPLMQSHSLDDALLPAARALQGELGAMANGLDYRGVPVLAYAAAIPETPWVMIAKEDEEEIYAPLARIARATAAATLLLVLAAAAAVGVWWRGQVGRHRVELLEQELERGALVRHFDYLAKYANDIILLWDESKRLLEVNDRALEAYGYPRERLVGMPVGDLLAPEERPSTERMLSRLRTAGHMVLESVHQRGDGSRFPVEASIRRIDQSGRVFYQCILRDISERKQAEAHILSLSRLYHTLSEANQGMVRATDRSSLFEMVCRVAVEYGKFQLAWVGTANGETGKIGPVAGHGPGRAYLQGLDIRLDEGDALGRGPTATALREGEPRFCDDFRRAPETAPWHDRARAHGIAASAALPLRCRGEVVAVLNLYAAEASAFDADTRELVQEMAADLSFALDRFEDQKDLLAERDRAQGYLDVAGVMLIVLDLAGRVTLINRKGLGILGYESEEEDEVLGREWFESFVPPMVRDRVSEEFREITHGAIQEYYEDPILTRDGEERMIAWRISVLRDAEGAVVGVLGSGEDITERRAAERALAQSRALLESLIDSIPDLIFYKDSEGVYLGCNRAFEAFSGRAEEEIVGRTDYDLVDAGLASFFRDQDRIMLESGRPRRNEEWVAYPDGRRVLMETLKTPYDGPDGERLGLIGISRDITARKRIEEQLKRSEDSLNRAQAVAHVGSWSLDFATDRLECSGEAYRICGAEPGEPLGWASFLSRVDARDRGQAQAAWHEAQTTGRLDLECRIQVGEQEKWVHVRAEMEPGEDGRPRAALGTLQDVTERKSAEERIVYLAQYDGLTGLPNRQLLEDRLEYAISIMARRARSPAAVLFLDLDRFKNINDSLGHRTGDRLLRKVGERLRTSVRDEDTVARPGGDEFVMVLPDTSAKGAALVAEKVISSLSHPFRIEGRALSISCSIGIAMYPDNGESSDSLVRCADTAMYRAKTGGGAGYQFFTEAMHLEALRRLELESALRHAVAAGAFSLHYQPQVEAATGTIVGVEALARWWHEEWGYVPPSAFIPLAEDSGLILPLGERILDQAIAQARAWQERTRREIPVAVNLSVVQLRQHDFFDTVDRLLTRHGLAPRLLELEITESIAMLEAETAVELMGRLHQRGITLSIDDFGTGYSSLSYLKRFNARKLKVDASFVRGLPDDENDVVIVNTIIRMGHSLGLKVLAEGVETPEQAAFLREQGCDLLQGYHFGRPGPAEDVSELLQAETIAD